MCGYVGANPCGCPAPGQARVPAVRDRRRAGWYFQYGRRPAPSIRLPRGRPRAYRRSEGATLPDPARPLRVFPHTRRQLPTRRSHRPKRRDLGHDGSGAQPHRLQAEPGRLHARDAEDRHRHLPQRPRSDYDLRRYLSRRHSAGGGLRLGSAHPGVASRGGHKRACDRLRRSGRHDRADGGERRIDPRRIP